MKAKARPGPIDAAFDAAQALAARHRLKVAPLAISDAHHAAIDDVMEVLHAAEGRHQPRVDGRSVGDARVGAYLYGLAVGLQRGNGGGL
jgi:sirohydrochlorin ferrochelatase